MTPILLKISGVFSYQTLNVIDFQKLSSQGIFGIFGDVGSGKSAIIDAMTFVLYGDYHRSPNKNTYYNLMNLKSNESLIEFKFEHNNKNYFFQYTAKRSKNNFQNITSQSRKGYENIDGQLIPLPSNNGGQILDLDFEEFIKLVIIPQGQFAEFINLTDSNRTKMLKKILKLDKYSLHSPTSKLLHSAKEDIALIDGQLMVLGSIDESTIAAQEQKLAETTIENEKLSLKINDLKKSSEELNILKSLHAELKKWQEEFNNIKEDDNRMSELEEDLKSQHVIHTSFSHVYNDKIRLSAEYSDSINHLNKISQELNDKQSEYESLAIEKKNILHNLIDINELQIEHDKQLVIKKVINIKQKQDEAIVKRDNNNIHIDQQRSELQNSKIQLDEFNKRIEQLNNAAFQETHVKEQLNNIHQIQKIDSKLIQLSQEISNIKQELNEFGLKKSSTLNNLHKTHNINVVEDEKINQNIASLLKEKDNCLQKKHVLEAQYAELSQISALHNYAQHLHDDHPCPLCGSLEHPQPFDNQEIQSKSKKLHDDIKINDQKSEDISLCIKELENLIELFKFKSSELKKMNEELNKSKEERLELYNLLDKEQNESSLLHLLNNINNAKKEATTLTLQQKKLHEDIQQLEKNLNTLVAQDCSSLISQFQGEIDTLTKTYNLKENDFKDYSQELVYSLQNRLIKAKENETKINTIILYINKLEAQIEVQSNICNNLNDRLQDLENQWSSLLSNNSFTESYIIDKLENRLDINASLEIVREHQNKKGNILFKINEIQTLIKGKEYNETSHQDINNELQNLEEKTKANSSIIHQLTNDTKRLRTNLELKKSLLDKHNILDNRIKNLETLLGLFRGEKFVEYISKQYTQHLFMLANKRFKKLTFNQLELSLDSDSNFSIIDYMNDKRPRSIKTLSGGQLFQASLCLALALSEQLQLIQNQHQQFFFIDEGFGTLDKDSLNTVLETLKELKKEGRTVGIISHVDELREDIDLNIIVNKDNNTGSQIHINY